MNTDISGFEPVNIMSNDGKVYGPDHEELVEQANEDRREKLSEEARDNKLTEDNLDEWIQTQSGHTGGLYPYKLGPAPVTPSDFVEDAETCDGSSLNSMGGNLMHNPYPIGPAMITQDEYVRLGQAYKNKFDDPNVLEEIYANFYENQVLHSELMGEFFDEINKKIYKWMKTDPGGVDTFGFSNFTESSSDVFSALYGMSTLEKSSKTIGHLFDKYILNKDFAHSYKTANVNMGELAGLALTAVVTGVGIINTWTTDSGNTNEQRLIKTFVQVGSAAANMMVGIVTVAAATGCTVFTAGIGTAGAAIIGGIILVGGLAIVNNWKNTVYETYDIE